MTHLYQKYLTQLSRCLDWLKGYMTIKYRNHVAKTMLREPYCESHVLLISRASLFRPLSGRVLEMRGVAGECCPRGWSIITEFSPSCVYFSLWACFYRCSGLPRSPRGKQLPHSVPVPSFKDVAKEAGLTVSHISSPEKKYIVDSMSGGAGLIDCDNDGKLDIITVNGSTIERYRQGGDPMITLYHQDANFKFTDITSAGLTRKGWGMGVAVADFDNDGLPDIYVTGFGGNVLYRNLGNCNFEDVTEKAGVRGRLQHGAAWADYDRDGFVDLSFRGTCTSTWIIFPPSAATRRIAASKESWCSAGPGGMIGEWDLLFHNRGDGTFEEVSKKSGMEDSEPLLWIGSDLGRLRQRRLARPVCGQ